VVAVREDSVMSDGPKESVGALPPACAEVESGYIVTNADVPRIALPSGVDGLIVSRVSLAHLAIG